MELIELAEQTKAMKNSIDMEFVLIPPGDFMMGSCISPEESVEKYGGVAGWYEFEHPRHEVKISKPFYLQTDFWRMNRNGTQKLRLTWFHAPGHPHFFDREFAVAADFDWSPNGKQIAGLVITHRPDTRKRGSGMIVLIDLPGE